MSNAEWSSRRRVGAVCTLIAVLAIVGWWPDSSHQATEEYWNHVHTLASYVDSIQNLETTEQVIDTLQALEQQLDSLNVEGVDQVAVDATARFRLALTAALRCAEHVDWIGEHPVRTTLSRLIGNEVTEKLRSRLVDVREKSLQAHKFAIDAHRKLTEKYPDSTFATPVPPDVQPINEILLQLDASQEAEGTFATLGEILGALLLML